MTKTIDPLCQSLPQGRSGRTALVSHERDSVWLYLTKPNSSEVERDCWLFNSSDAPEHPDIAQYRNEAPPAPRRVTTEGGVRDAQVADRWDFRWTDDGEAVAVLLNAVVIGLIKSSRARGYSRHLAKDCSWGSPLDDDTLNKTFSERDF